MELYIEWRGDLLIREDGFHIADNIILSELVYLDLRPVFGHIKKNEATLQECGRILKETGTYCLKTLTGGHEDLIYKICESRRFRDIRVREYEDIFSEDQEIQFAAAEFEIDAGRSYVAFRGTDNTIIGWKEDFMMSFTEIPSQKYAAQYLQRIMRPFRKYYVGGHSKGGNLAMYSCAMLPEKKRNKILHIFSNDGPGFSPEVLPAEKLEPYGDRLTKLLPAFAVIGRIFENSIGEKHIVRCDDNTLMAHDLIYWRILGKDEEAAESFEPVSEWMTTSIDEWVEKISYEERRLFVEDMFSALMAGGASTVQEVTGKGFIRVVSAAATSSPTSKKLILDLASEAIAAGRKKDDKNGDHA